MTDRKVLWDTPVGELFIFNNEDEVKLFWCKLGLEPELMEDLGVSVEHNDEEWFVDTGKVFIAPVFDPNQFMNYDEESYNTSEEEFLYKPEDLKLDEVIYRDYPLVAYVNIMEDYDRSGPSKVQIVVIKPLKELMTVQSAQDIENKYDKIWKKNREEALDWERKRDEYMKNKK